MSEQDDAKKYGSPRARGPSKYKESSRSFSQRRHGNANLERQWSESFQSAKDRAEWQSRQIAELKRDIGEPSSKEFADFPERPPILTLPPCRLYFDRTLFAHTKRFVIFDKTTGAVTESDGPRQPNTDHAEWYDTTQMVGEHHESGF